MSLFHANILNRYSNSDVNSFHTKFLTNTGLTACVVLTIFVSYSTLFGQLPGPAQYCVALTLGLVAVFLLFPGPLDSHSQSADDALSILLSLASIGTGIYYLLNYQVIAEMREGLPNVYDLACYSIGIFCVMEAARRTEGWILLGIVLAGFLYMAFGHIMPGIMEHRPFWISEVLEISFSYQGIFGIALGSVVNVVLTFVIFGAALQITGAGDFFNFIALRLTKGFRSGPAQTAILASSLFGSINGSAPANVASTGILTIPLMRRAGYSPAFAGGVEATASCVGQIMPPIMGVGAFIMSEITGIPYSSIMLAAIIPSFLFILSLMIAVYLQAERDGLEPIDDDFDTSFNETRKAQGILMLSAFGVLLVLLFNGFSPTFCGLVATITVLILSMAFKSTRLDFEKFMNFLIDGGRNALTVMVACAAIGIVIGAFTSTGFGIKLNQMIVAVGDGNLIWGLMLAALCSIVLGMGLPTAASYLMVIFVAGPAIMDLGVGLLQTHLFVFYFAVLSAITPPVALALFAAAAIAKVSPMKIAVHSIKLAAVAFVLPFAWVLHPEINLQATDVLSWSAAIMYTLQLVVAVFSAEVGLIGTLGKNLKIPVRITLIILAACVLSPIPLYNITATILAIAILAIIIWKPFQNKSTSKSASNS